MWDGGSLLLATSTTSTPPREAFAFSLLRRPSATLGSHSRRLRAGNKIRDGKTHACSERAARRRHSSRTVAIVGAVPTRNNGYTCTPRPPLSMQL
eukprot:COSAG01_NODE_1997_length_8691_cov_5.509777_10_plen_95_part_00